MTQQCMHSLNSRKKRKKLPLPRRLKRSNYRPSLARNLIKRKLCKIQKRMLGSSRKPMMLRQLQMRVKRKLKDEIGEEIEAKKADVDKVDTMTRVLEWICSSETMMILNCSPINSVENTSEK